MCDREGIIGKDYPNLNWMQQKMTEVTNLENQNGTLADALKGADIFVGVSAPNIVTPEMVASMNHDSILFAMANPVPEIMPDVAKAAGARIVGTGRSDFPNQVNNVVAFPGIFEGCSRGTGDTDYRGDEACRRRGDRRSCLRRRVKRRVYYAGSI